MKPFFVFLLVSILTVALSACDELAPAGPTGTDTYTVRDFQTLRIAGNITADVRLGTSFSVKATGVERDLNDLRVVVDKGRLTVDYQTWHAHRSEMRLFITLPILRGVDLSGSVQANLIGVSETPTFSLDLSGTSQLEGTVRTGQLTANVDGDTRLQLSGWATQLLVDGSGTATVYGFGLQTDETRLNLSGQSYTEVSVAKQLVVRASGQCRVRYRGTPETILEVTGRSRVERE